MQEEQTVRIALLIFRTIVLATCGIPFVIILNSMLRGSGSPPKEARILVSFVFLLLSCFIFFCMGVITEHPLETKPNVEVKKEITTP